MKRLDDADRRALPGSRAAAGERRRTWLVGVATLLVCAVVAAVLFPGLNPLARADGGSATSYAFLQQQPRFPTVPVRWDPCHPIHVEINDAFIPDRARGLVEEGIADVAEASGLDFVVDGRTSEPVEWGRPLVEGGEFRPVLIAWASPELDVSLGDDVVGRGGSRFVEDDTGYRYYVTGQIELDTADIERLLDRRDGRAVARTVVEHELGHVLGLAHVGDDHQVMYPSVNGRGSLGAGDRAGMRRAGQGPCQG